MVTNTPTALEGVTVLPTGEVVSTTTPAPTADPTGRIPGIDGMLDQVAGAVVRQAVPALRDQILPVLQNDRALQRTVGRAAGEALAQKLWPFAFVTTAAAVIASACYVVRTVRGAPRTRADQD